MRQSHVFLRNIIFIFIFSQTHSLVSQNFQDSSLPLKQRVQLLINELTLEEKVSLMVNKAAAIDRLNIPEYNWWNEGLHGVARSVPATVFPQAIGMAATFNPNLVYRVATAISDEGRAIYNHAQSKGVYRWYTGLTFWSPNVNIFRDPRWGRGHETYGEDPFLSGALGKAFVQGMQGNDKNHLKVAACAKHFMVHNGPEGNRFTFNSETNKKDLYETYLPAFQDLIDTGVAGVMCAYNKYNTESCCGSSNILSDVLRKEMGFDGYIVSDCGAINNLHDTHKVTRTPEESAALGVLSGVNVNCGQVYSLLLKSIELGLLTEKDVNKALSKQLEIRFKLGMFDLVPINPYTTISIDKINNQAHVALAREVAQKSMVLLKNSNNILPLKKGIGQIYVTGNNAADVNVLLGNYYGVSKNMVTVLEGIASTVSKTTIVQYNQGFLVQQDVKGMKTGQSGNAANADATIAVIGLNPLFEGENGDTPFSITGGDRKTIELPENQLIYLKKLKEQISDKPLIVVVCSGSAIAMPEVHDIADAIVWAWYPGEQGGQAVADVLFGNYSPSGKLPITIYKATSQLGDFEDYSISESKKTYRYFEDSPLYPFGFGLSYQPLDFKLEGTSKLSMKSKDTLNIKIKVRNLADFEQNEVIQLYVSKTDLSYPTPLFALKNIQNVTLKAGQSKRLTFKLCKTHLQQINDKGEKELPKGVYKICIGTTSPAARNIELGAQMPIELTIKLK
ncbi:glycoside hydrolase family 3 C-terminal domain-containing protein [Tamlana fucoidanivorans]|uniref:Glycoside hydrolase family 3 protein n=1 Tax=Allotamlana fucoidanivorans TaxID=2583814 RepID=A0A5C4SLX4_9FLAO|nr:glycoside hydrolase family 3 C-terminal domain-containing protein [Tamlana fucoidanivorans]TNJ44905.1 glycoside hydrolase family 3 protein [Tamlana fucoidanivorans]